MEISKYNSDKIKVLSFIAIIFVIYIHAPFTEAAEFHIADKVQKFVADFGLAIFAVPLFYAISGMLFFRGVEKVSDLYPKLKKRIKSLLVPYIIWNIIFVLWYVLLAYTPGVKSFVNSDMLSTIQWQKPWETLEFLFIEPAGFHLWFLRDLITFVAMSPLLYVLSKRFPWLTLIAVFITTAWYPRFGLCFFTAGGILATHYSFEKLKSILSKPVIIVCGLIYIFNAIITITLGTCMESIWWQYYEKLISFASLFFVWGVYDYYFIKESKISPRVYQIISYTFFIYLFHNTSLKN